LQVLGRNNERYIVMSNSAFESLNKQQINQLEKYGKILYSSLDTIEACGGGSARCMMAEVFLPKEE
ncbi:MAG TPA: arginine deiminase-related protein, partial [Lutibacter sp.]|nr:arginine deiminase-related protein [Lutibacter sp.]